MTNRHAVAAKHATPTGTVASAAHVTANLTALVESVARAFPEYGLPPLPPDRWLVLYRALSPFVDGADGTLPPDPKAGECPRCRRTSLTPRTLRRRRWWRVEERVVWECDCGWAPGTATDR